MPFTTLIDAHALRGLIGDSDVAIIDCRFDLANPAAGRNAYLQGHIPGARYADLDADLSSAITASSGRHPLPDPDEFALIAGTLGIGNDSQTIVYDAVNGSIAARAWWLLQWLGATRVAVLDGGYTAWLAAGGAVQPGWVAAATARFTPKPRGDAWVSTEQVRTALDEKGRILLDARTGERFEGRVEPIDAVAGHIPGAVNFPFSGNLDSDGRFLPPPALRERWQRRLDGKSAADAILMCGSGVTACHNLLALELAGLPGAKLYAGSWSEWIRDPARPTARGAA
jgi:thiosulfate/3-mercaptopyruvate sulfurtransferase